MSFASVTLEGGPALQIKLQNLAIKTQRKLVRQAVRAGTKVMLPVAKANARQMVGGNMGSVIASALQIRAMKSQRPGQYALKIQHSKNYDDQLVSTTQAGERQYIPNAIEYGHVAPDGSDVPAKPYMRTAFMATQATARVVIAQNIIAAIEREWNSGR